jgi:Tfp pilus assembly ATPase PilU
MNFDQTINPDTQLTLPDLLKKMTEMGGSDLHVTTNSPPQVRHLRRHRPNNWLIRF